MTRNGKLMTAAAAVIAVLLAPIAAVASTSSPSSSHQPVIIHVVEHAITDTVQQFHPPKNSLGDVLGFHNPVFNAANKRQIATDNGYCIRTNTTLAITGGTGNYIGAEGSMLLHATGHPVGSEFDFIFTLTH